MGHLAPLFTQQSKSKGKIMSNIRTFRQELISYDCDQRRLKWLQGQIDKLKLELNKKAEIICSHADATKGQALLVMPELQDEDIEPFTVFILQPENWSRKDQTQNLRVEALTEIKTRSHPSVDGSTSDSLEES